MLCYPVHQGPIGLEKNAKMPPASLSNRFAAHEVLDLVPALAERHECLSIPRCVRIMPAEYQGQRLLASSADEHQVPASHPR